MPGGWWRGRGVADLAGAVMGASAEVRGLRTEIVVQRRRIYAPRGCPGFAWHYQYLCVGPDGTRFENSSLHTLRKVLRRRYAAVELRFSGEVL